MRPNPRLRRPQLRTQVLAGVLLVTLVALAAFDVAAVSALRRYLVSRTDSNLRTVLSLARPLAMAVPPYARAALPGQVASQAARTRRYGRRHSVTLVGPHVRLAPPFLDQYYLAFVRPSQAEQVFVRGNPALIPRRFDISARPGWRRTVMAMSIHGNQQLRVGAIAEAGGTLVASTSMAEVNKTVGRLRLILIIGSAAAALLVCAGVAAVLRRGLRPIEAMAAQADRITAGDLTDRVSAGDARTEVGRLGAALNGMLTRIEAAVAERAASQEQTRRFFADASHELRTPLASLRANAELYQQGALPHRPQVDEAMRRITLEAQRMGRLVDDMLRLARLDQMPAQQHEPVDLSDVVAGSVERARIASPGRAWRTIIEPGLMTAGDTELLRRAVDNLLANVTAHTPGDVTGTVTAAADGDHATIEVADDGPGVADGDLPRIFDRFYRSPGQQSACPGSGLGLAIVAAVAAAHGGTASAAPNRPRGLRVTIRLPVLARLEPDGAGPDEAAGRDEPVHDLEELHRADVTVTAGTLRA